MLVPFTNVLCVLWKYGKQRWERGSSDEWQRPQRQVAPSIAEDARRVLHHLAIRLQHGVAAQPCKVDVHNVCVQCRQRVNFLVSIMLTREFDREIAHALDDVALADRTNRVRRTPRQSPEAK